MIPFANRLFQTPPDVRRLAEFSRVEFPIALHDLHLASHSVLARYCGYRQGLKTVGADVRIF